MIEILPSVVKIIILEYLCDSGCWLQYKLFCTDVYNWLKAQPGLYLELESLSVWQDKFKSEAYKYYFDEQMVLLRDGYNYLWMIMLIISMSLLCHTVIG